MLTAFNVHDWKSAQDAILNVDPLTVLIGTNSSGKSNILDALSFLTRISSGVLLTSALQGDGILPQLRGGLEWAPRRPTDTFSLSATHRVNETQDLTYRIECCIHGAQCEVVSEELLRTRYKPGKDQGRGAAQRPVSLFRTDRPAESSPTVTARLYNSKAGTARQMSRASSVLYQLLGQKTLAEIQDGVEQVIGSLRNIFILDPFPSNMRNFSQLSDRLAPDASNIAGVLAALPKDNKLAVERTLTEYVSQLPERDITRVYAEPVGKFGSDAMLYCEEGFGRTSQIDTVDARGMSDGTLRFLAILTALLTRPANSLLVVEEVDNGLHPSRSHLLLRMLATVGKDRKVDVMVTTHNPALLDAMGTEMLPFITVSHRDPENGATLLTLLEDVAQLPKLLAQGLVGKLSSSGLIEEALIGRDGERHPRELERA
ncbi:MAG: ATP-binding protein [Gluconacetobacter diazotrophicus]|nr:ATP-binding protein [Gluconacetobacter diazotrophicus]